MEIPQPDPSSHPLTLVDLFGEHYEPDVSLEARNDLPANVSVRFVFYDSLRPTALAEAQATLDAADVIVVDGLDYHSGVDQHKYFNRAAQKTKPGEDESRYQRELAEVLRPVRRSAQFAHDLMEYAWGSGKFFDTIEGDKRYTKAIHEGLANAFAGNTYLGISLDEAIKLFDDNAQAVASAQREHDEVAISNLADKMTEWSSKWVYEDDPDRPYDVSVAVMYNHYHVPYMDIAAHLGIEVRDVDMGEDEFPMSPIYEAIMRYRIGLQPSRELLAKAVLTAVTTRAHEQNLRENGFDSPTIRLRRMHLMAGIDALNTNDIEEVLAGLNESAKEEVEFLRMPNSRKTRPRKTITIDEGHLYDKVLDKGIDLRDPAKFDEIIENLTNQQ